MTNAVPLPTPRIDPLRDANAEQAQALSKVPARPDGTTRNVFLTLAHHPRLLDRFNAFAGTFFRYGQLAADERELIILRVSAYMRCPYELAQHIDIARADGLDDSTILAALEQVGGGSLSARQQLLLRATDSILASGAIDDVLWQQLSTDCDEAQLIELISIVGFYRYAADLMNVVGIAVEGPIDLPVDWMPEQLVPSR